MIGDDFNRLDLKDIANWPLAPKAVLLAILAALILAAGYSLDWNTQLDELAGVRAKELQLRDTFAQKSHQASNLDVYKQQLKDIEQAFGALLKQLPNKSEMDALLTDINQAGLGRGLQFDLFKPGAESMSEFYAELPIAIKVTGSYHDLGAFASDIAQLSRIVTLHDINIIPGKDAVLAMDAVVKTYRYLDEEEMAASKKAKKP